MLINFNYVIQASLTSFAAENIPVMEMSTLTEEGIIKVKTEVRKR